MSLTKITLDALGSSIAINADALTSGTVPLNRLSAANSSANGIVTTSGQTFAGDKTFQNTVTVTGNLTVLGTSVTLNSENVLIKDNIITLNSNVTGSPVLDAGIEVNRGTSANVTLKWNETSDLWQLTNDGTNYGDLLTTLSSTGVNASALSTGTVPLARLTSANTSANGVVDTTTQTFAGDKTFQNTAAFSNTVSITGAANALSTLGVGGTLSALGQLSVTGNATFDTNTLFVDAANNYVGIGNAVPTHKLTVDISSTSGVVGSMANAYPVVQFGNQSSDATRRALEIGVVGGSVTAPVYLKVVGTGNRFAIFNQSNTEQFTIDSSGNIGVGVTPSAWTGYKALEIGTVGSGVAATTSSGTIQFNGSYYYASGDKFGVTGNYAMYFSAIPGDGSYRWYTSTATGTAGNAATMAERMRIDSSGRVGIGATSPTSILHLSGPTPVLRLSSNNAANAQFKLCNNNLDDHGLHLLYNPQTAVGYIENTYQAASGQVYGDIEIRQNVAGTQTTRMIVKADGGNVGIGKTSPSAKLDVLGNIRHSNTSGGYLALTHDLTGYTSGQYATLKTDDTCLYFDVAGVYTGYICNSGGFTDVSDGRLKTNVSTIMNATSAVLQLRGVNYAWKDGRDNFQNHTGFIAQEVQAVIPDVVSDGCAGEDCNGPGILGVQDSALLPWIVEAFKEMYTEIQTLRARVAALEG